MQTNSCLWIRGCAEWGVRGQRTIGVQQKLQQEVDCFIELVCGDVTKRGMRAQNYALVFVEAKRLPRRQWR